MSNAEADSERPPSLSTDRVLDVLERQSCRTLLRALGPTPQTVNEIDEDCPLPVSSIYRCLHELVDANLVVESTRLREKGRHPNEYALNVDEIVIDVTASDGPTVELRRTTADEP